MRYILHWVRPSRPPFVPYVSLPQAVRRVWGDVSEKISLVDGCGELVLLAPFGHGEPGLSLEEALEERRRGVPAELRYRVEFLDWLYDQPLRGLDLHAVDFVEYGVSGDRFEPALGQAS